MKTVKFCVEDMLWPSCAEKIEVKLSGVDGVAAAYADVNSNVVTVLFAYPQSCEKLYCAVEDIGYHIGDRTGWFG